MFLLQTAAELEENSRSENEQGEFHLQLTTAFIEIIVPLKRGGVQ